MSPYFPGKTIIYDDVPALAGMVSAHPDSLIAIDGIDGEGKTPLAKNLSATLGWKRVDLDHHFIGGPIMEMLRFDDVESAISPRPVIVAGIHMLEVLDRLGLRPDFLIYVVHMSRNGPPSHLDLIRRDTNPEMSEGQDEAPLRIGGVTLKPLRRLLWTYMHRWKPVTAADVVFAWP
ncbi:MAG: hypothetical protein ACRC67_43720 [Inquilinus sp.]|uniref:hypothetical protein n=1 Tax=Inquilinus sp. TaxID=1932117 RepID=UPI003F3D80FC